MTTDSQRSWYKRNRERILAELKNRSNSDPAYRESKRVAAGLHYRQNRERVLQRHRDRYVADEQFKSKKIDSSRRRNARLLPEEVAFHGYSARCKKAGIVANFAEWAVGYRERAAHRKAGRCPVCAAPKVMRGRCRSCDQISTGRYFGVLRNAIGFHTASEWQAILRSHKHRCATCGSRDRITKDHIIPLARGGSNYAFNLQPLCLSCNSRKRDRIGAGAQHSLFDALKEARPWA